MQSSAKPVKFDKNNGIMFGGKNDEIVLTIDILCSNATIKNDKAVTLQLTASGTANVTMKDLMIYPNISSMKV